MSRPARARWRAALGCTLLAALAAAAAEARPEDELRAAWVGRWVVLRTPTQSDCGERYTDNRLRGPLPASQGRHHLDSGEIGRVDNLHLRRARIDVLVSLAEPLRVELRDGPFQLYQQLSCRVELEVAAPRDALRRGAVDRLDEILRAALEPHADQIAAEASPLANGRRVEPLPADHDERWAAYLAWQEERLYAALRQRLVESLERADELVGRADRSVAYARGLVSGARDFEPRSLFSAACEELPEMRFGAARGQPPEGLEERDEGDWRDGFEDGQRLRFEIALARRLERCLS